MIGLDTKAINLTEEQITEIISKQFYYCNKEFNDAIKDPNWRRANTLSPNEHDEWLEWTVNYIMIARGISEREAQIDASWFEIKYGLSIDNSKR